MTLSDSCQGRRPRWRCGGRRTQDRSPTLPVMPCRRAVPTTPADRTAARVGRFAVRAAFPVLCAGRHPPLHFRGVLRVHSRYGPPARSTAQGGLCREAPIRPVAQPNRSPATRPTDSYLDGTFIHWHHAPFVAHQRRREDIGKIRNPQMNADERRCVSHAAGSRENPSAFIGGYLRSSALDLLLCGLFFFGADSRFGAVGHVRP